MTALLRIKRLVSKITGLKLKAGNGVSTEPVIGNDPAVKRSYTSPDAHVFNIRKDLGGFVIVDLTRGPQGNNYVLKNIKSDKLMTVSSGVFEFLFQDPLRKHIP